MYDHNFGLKTTTTRITLVTVFSILWFLFCLASSVGIIYAAVHFALKFW